MGRKKLRKIHRVGWAKKLGSLADLNQDLVTAGYSFQVNLKKPYHETGVAVYVDGSGRTAVLKRVERGKEARWTGRTVGIVRTAATPDVWALVGKSDRKKAMDREERKLRKLR